MLVLGHLLLESASHLRLGRARELGVGDLGLRGGPGLEGGKQLLQRLWSRVSADLLEVPQVMLEVLLLHEDLVAELEDLGLSGLVVRLDGAWVLREQRAHTSQQAVVVLELRNAGESWFWHSVAVAGPTLNKTLHLPLLWALHEKLGWLGAGLRGVAFDGEADNSASNLDCLRGALLNLHSVFDENKRPELGDVVFQNEVVALIADEGVEPRYRDVADSYI